MMGNPWDAEYLVTEELAKQLIESQFPELKGADVKLLGNGFDNTVFQINDTYVFRFPRRPLAVGLIETEGRVLPELSRFISIPYPKPIFFGKPSNEYPYPFLGYVMVRGELPSNLTREQRIRAAKPFAYFLKSLHSFPVERALELGVKYDEMRKMDLSYRKPMLGELIEKLPALGFQEEYELVKDYLNKVEPFPCPEEKVFAHGDLHFRNVLVDEDGHLAGIIDWGDMHVGHRSVDLSILYDYLTSEGREIFYEIYGEIDEETKKLARFKAMFTTVILLLFGADVKDDALVDIATETIRLALEGD